MYYCCKCGSKLAAQQIDNQTRLACSATYCDYVHWDNPTPVVAAIVEFDKKIVLARNKKWPPGIMSVITGYLEKGESPEEAVIREVKEELNLDTLAHQFVGYYSFFPANQLILAFTISAVGDIFLAEELTEYELIPNTDVTANSFNPAGMPIENPAHSALIAWLISKITVNKS